MRVYISGPMTDIVDLNHPAFFAAEQALLEHGHEPVNPARNELPSGSSWTDYMRVDLTQLLTCTAIYMLDGWENSKGARLEHHVASELGLIIVQGAL